MFKGVLIKKNDHLCFSLHCFESALRQRNQQMSDPQVRENWQLTSRSNISPISTPHEPSRNSCYSTAKSGQNFRERPRNSATIVHRELTKAHSLGGQHSQAGASPATAAKYLFFFSHKPFPPVTSAYTQQRNVRVVQPSLHLLRLRHARQSRMQRPRLIQLARVGLLILVVGSRVAAPHEQDVPDLELDVLRLGHGEEVRELDGVGREGVVWPAVL